MPERTRERLGVGEHAHCPSVAGESAKSPGKSLELVAISGILSPAKVIAYAWGDMVTDVIARFRAISLLGVAKLGFRDIMGCCMI